MSTHLSRALHQLAMTHVLGTDHHRIEPPREQLLESARERDSHPAGRGPSAILDVIADQQLDAGQLLQRGGVGARVKVRERAEPDPHVRAPTSTARPVRMDSFAASASSTAAIPSSALTRGGAPSVIATSSSRSSIA